MAKPGVWKQRGRWFDQGLADGYFGRPFAGPVQEDWATAYRRGYQAGVEVRKQHPPSLGGP
jgi:hypothetical protein